MLRIVMDMPTPQGPATAQDAAARAMLDRLGRMLDCSPERFFDAARAGKPKDASQLLKMWLAIKNPEGREAVFAFVDEILQAETHRARRTSGT